MTILRWFGRIVKFFIVEVCHDALHGYVLSAAAHEVSHEDPPFSCFED